MAEPSTPTISAQDVPWRLAAVASIGFPASAAPPFSEPPGEPALTGLRLYTEYAPMNLRPSVRVFYHPVPLADSRDAFPGERIVLMKVAATLTGLTPYSTDGDFEFAPTAPCVGAIVFLHVGRLVAEAGKTRITDDGIYIRDIYPKRQETVVNELLGEETLQRSSSSVSTTKSWNTSSNISGSIPISGGDLGFGANRETSESRTTQSEQERSQRNSRQTEVNNIHHVLTAYHLAKSTVGFSVQPRPFEGENWELLDGFRVLEGIQEFIVIANVPYDLDKLWMSASLLLGFRVEVINPILHIPPDWGNLWFAVPTTDLYPSPTSGPYPSAIYRPTPPLAPVRIGYWELNTEDWYWYVPATWSGTPRGQELLLEEIPNVTDADPWSFGKKWQQFADEYRKFIEFDSFMDELEREPYLLATSISTDAQAQLFWGDDPCADGGPPDPCRLSPTGKPAAGYEDPYAGFAAVTHVSSNLRFHEHRLRPTVGLVSMADRRRAANRDMQKMFKQLSASRSARREMAKPLVHTQFYRSLILSEWANLAKEDPANTPIEPLIKSIPEKERESIRRFGLERISDVARLATVARLLPSIMPIGKARLKRARLKYRKGKAERPSPRQIQAFQEAMLRRRKVPQLTPRQIQALQDAVISAWRASRARKPP